MNVVKIPPYIVIQSSKEVIFYLSKNNNSDIDIKDWIKELNLAD